VNQNIIIVFVVTGFVALIYNQTTYAVESSDLIYSINETPFGTSYSEWIGKWWQWHLSIPNKINQQDPTNLTLAHPREAYSPKKCQLEQKDKNVWFLPDGRNLKLSEANAPEIRKCTIPHDKALLVQIYGGGCSYGEGLKTDKELRDCVDIGLDTVKFSAKVDGVEVMSSDHRNDFLPEPHLCRLKYVKDNLYDVQARTYKAMARGYFLFVKPLSVGDHKIEFNAKFFDIRTSNVVYDLTVK
jgi:hypothetical protein